MTKRILASVLVVGAVAALAGCSMEKSSNPLSPSIAGPIPGVTITAPKLLSPLAGQKIAVDNQPVTLMVENATTNGVRPVSYLFEVASDAAFASKVFTQSGVTPGDGGRTTLKLPDPLATGHTYYWRAQALDGANSSTVPSPANFDVYTPVVIQAVVLSSPADGAVVTSVQPTLTVRNVVRSGPAGAITYLFQVADSAAFANIAAELVVAEGSSSTSWTVPRTLDNSKTYYWRARAADPSVTGPWSATQSFKTPDVVVVAPTPTPPSGGGAAADQINLGAATILNSPLDIASWPVTSALTAVDIQSRGIAVTFDRKSGGGRWPDVTPPGWSGPLEYTLGMCLYIGSQWYCSAVVEYWYGLEYSGGPPSEYALNWFYDPGRWAPMTGHQPAVGETIGFYVCEGDCRNNRGGTLSPLRERTNVVLVKMPSDSGAIYRF